MILVTGGLGYIGPQLVTELRDDPRTAKERIVIFDNLRGRFDYAQSPLKSHKTFQNLMDTYDDVELVIGDVRYNTDLLFELITDARVVYHLAAVTGADHSDEAKELYWSTIFQGTANVMEGVRRSGTTERVVNMSSCNIYGEAEETELTEESDLYPINTYARAKRDAEELLLSAHESSDVPVVALRMATNFGAQEPSLGGTRNNLVVNKFVYNALHGQPLTPYGDGSNWRPFVHVKDSARIIKEFGLAGEEVNGEVYNAGFDELNHTVEEITSTIRSRLEGRYDIDIEVNYLREKYEGPSYNVSFEKMSGILDLEPTFGIEESIDHLVKFYDEEDGIAALD